MSAHGATEDSSTSTRGSNIPQALAHSPKDNVAVVVVEGLRAGTDALVVVTEDDTSSTIRVEDDVPIVVDLNAQAPGPAERLEKLAARLKERQ